MRAPLLYGPGVSQGRGEASSGGSTAEAVQEEVRRQLRGFMDELAESRREAGNLREEVQRLRIQAEHRPTALPEPEGRPKVFGGYLDVDGNEAPTSSAMSGVSGAAPILMTMPGVSGAAPTSTAMPGVSGVSDAAATSRIMPPVSGSAATSMTMPQVSGCSTYIIDYASGVEYVSGIGSRAYFIIYAFRTNKWSLAAWCTRRSSWCSYSSCDLCHDYTRTCSGCGNR